MTKYRPITLSLFSGAGGLDIGFHNAGFNIVACVEVEEIFCQTLQDNKGAYFDESSQILNRDARLLDPEEVSYDHVDFIIGGPPCQSFSAIGRRAGGAQGVDDRRGSLFEEYCRLVNHFQPVGFLFENVRGIISANKGEDWKQIVNAFRKIGYQLTYRILSAADYGVPQRRERLILVGTRSNFTYQFPRPTHGQDSPGARPYTSALEAIKDLQEPDEPYHEYTGKYGHLLAEVPPGQNYHYFTERMGYPDPVFAWRSRFSDFLYKADPGEPVRTVVAKLGKYSGPFHWKNRRFTIPEMMRLQSFPDDYVIAGSKAQIMQQIGNSVPPLFAERLAESVLQTLFGQDVGMEVITQDFKLSFDKRKGKKAQKTRAKTKSYPLLDLIEERKSSSKGDATPQKELTRTTKVFCYKNPRKRELVNDADSCADGKAFTFTFVRKGPGCDIKVEQKNAHGKEHPPTIRYSVTFNRPVGDGLQKIECTLCAEDSAIYVAWDAIEDCIGQSSNYQTMFDVYGHFTEPHPIFTLNAELLTTTPDFFTLFASTFANFKKTQKVLPEKTIQEMLERSNNEETTFIDAVRQLRELRFDVRVHQTNTKIPLGFFRCCYPFSLSLNRQVAVTWTDLREESMNNQYSQKLRAALDEAHILLQNPDLEEYARGKYSQLRHPLKTQKGGRMQPLGVSLGEGLETIINNLDQNKYLYSIIVTALVEKMVHPKTDIRRHQADMDNGYSNRSTDQTYVTPFLKRASLTHCAASGMESGRNFERPLPLTLDFPAKPRGKGNKEATLGILHAVQEEGIDPFPCIAYIFALDIRSKKAVHYEYPSPEGLTIQEIVDVVVTHFKEAQRQGKSRLPVIAIQAIYECIVPELARYSDKELLALGRHTANDKLGAIGDVQINNPDGSPFEGVEVKSGKKITSDMVRAIPRKLQGYPVDRYYVLSTEEEYIAPDDKGDVFRAMEETRTDTGCEIVVNGLVRSLWYYLRLVTDKNEFLDNYARLLEEDDDIKDQHRKLWADLLANLEAV